MSDEFPKFSPETVAAWLSMPAPDDVVKIACSAVKSLINDLPTAPREPAPEGGEAWAAPTHLAATMLAARWVRRRNSPAGVEALAEQGPVYVRRQDPDVARLLRLDSYTPPQVG